MGDPPLLFGALQFSETVFVETPVTFKFCGLDGAPDGCAAAIFTFLEAWPTVLTPPSNCWEADVVTVRFPGVVGVQFMVAVQVATGVKEPLLTGVHVPAMVPRSVPLLIWKSKLTAPSSSSQDASAVSEAYVAVRT